MCNLQAVHYSATITALPLPLLHLCQQVEKGLLRVWDFTISRPAQELEMSHYQMTFLQLNDKDREKTLIKEKYTCRSNNFAGVFNRQGKLWCPFLLTNIHIYIHTNYAYRGRLVLICTTLCWHLPWCMICKLISVQLLHLVALYSLCTYVYLLKGRLLLSFCNYYNEYIVNTYRTGL